MRFRSGPGVLLIGVAMTFVVSAALPIWAHHSPPSGTYSDTFTDIQGVVTEVRLIQPHAWIILDVKGDEPPIWNLEATSGTGLQRIGVTPEYVKPGDTVKARCRRVIEGQRHSPPYNDCLLGFLKAKDGTVKDWSGNNAPAPADF